jgi:hypothetical protein
MASAAQQLAQARRQEASQLVPVPARHWEMSELQLTEPHVFYPSKLPTLALQTEVRAQLAGETAERPVRLVLQALARTRSPAPCAASADHHLLRRHPQPLVAAP